MSDSQVFLPIANEKQYNLLISLGTTFLRENLASMTMLVADGLDSPLDFESSTAESLINDISELKALVYALNAKRAVIKLEIPLWPVRIGLRYGPLFVVYNRLRTIANRIDRETIETKGNVSAHEWWALVAGVHPNDYDSLMVLFGSLEALNAQMPSQFVGTTVVMEAVMSPLIERI